MKIWPQHANDPDTFLGEKKKQIHCYKMQLFEKYQEQIL